MRTLKYAILGLLNQKEMTGYDLMKQFESTLCEISGLPKSQPDLPGIKETYRRRQHHLADRIL